MEVPRSISVVLPPFILTRAFVLLAFIIVPFLNSHQVGYWRELSVNKDVGVSEALRYTVTVADAIHYQALAEHGYLATEPHWGFFPVYPFLVSLFHADYYLTGILLSNAFFFGAILLLFYVSREFGLSEEQSTRSVWYLAIFPASYFFSAPMTESVFLCVTLLAVYLALKDQWWLAGLAGAVSSATRVTGVLLIVLLSLLYLERRKWKMGLDGLSLLLVPLGLAAFMVYAWIATGSPLAFIQAQALYSRNTSGVFFLRPLIDFVLHPRGFEGWQFAPLSFAVAVLVFFCIYKLARQKEWALAAYSFVCILVPLSTGILTSIPRYMAVVFPIYLVLARLEYDRVITYVFTALFVLLTALFALHYNFAMA